MMLDEEGIATSTGSACSSKKHYTSHVLKEIGLNEIEAMSSLRLSLGRDNTEKEVIYVSNVISRIVNKLRQMSPL